jgi:hypothetical protein
MKEDCPWMTAQHLVDGAEATARLRRNNLMQAWAKKTLWDIIWLAWRMTELCDFHLD